MRTREEEQLKLVVRLLNMLRQAKGMPMLSCREELRKLRNVPEKKTDLIS